MQRIARAWAFLFAALVLSVSPAAAQVSVGMDPETIRALNEAELAKVVIILGTTVGSGLIATLGYLLVRVTNANSKQQAAEDKRWDKFYADNRVDRAEDRQTLQTAAEANLKAAMAYERGSAETVVALKKLADRLDAHDTEMRRRDDSFRSDINKLTQEVRNGNATMTRAIEQGIEKGVQKGVSEGIVKAASELRAAFQPLIDEMKTREARNVQEDKKRDTGPLGGVDGGAAADADGDAGGGADGGAGASGDDNAV